MQMDIGRIIPAEIFFDPRQKHLYGLQVKCGQPIPGCEIPLFHTLKGKSNRGEFPLVFVREYFLTHGYKVLCSDSSRESSETFICTSFPILRRERPLHPAYERMTQFFPLEQLEEFNAIAEEEKRKHGKNKNRGGGDPDLFVYMENDPRTRFFVEVKHKDKPHTNQKIVFPLIEKHLGCPVYIIQINPKKAQS
jgi:hypothetical protein